MKSIQESLRKAYFTALSSLEVSGVSIPVYEDFADTDCPAHYIILTDQRSKELRVKRTFKHDAFITVDITTNFLPGIGGNELCDQISDEVLEILRPETGNIAIDAAFQIVNTTLDDADTLNEKLPAIWVFRKRLTFKHRIIQI